MRRIIAAALALLAIDAAASAADLPLRQPATLPAAPSWTGFHLGLNAGGAIGEGRSDFNLAGFRPPSFGISSRGAVGGAEAGYDWQAGPLVLGLEADFELSGLQGSRTTPCLPPICGLVTATYTQKLPWFGTLRPRIGYSGGSWLLYATGGFAYAQLDTDATAAFGPFVATHNRSETRNGWTLGGGAEVEFAPRWTAKIEYLHVDLGRRTTTFVLPSFSNASRLDFNLVRTGVNFHF
ncbi:outer membrane immunogenic protein [Rhizobiales bacterium GAS113]|nr:outer membrane immunogenic protein [Rhizobiales bacterium GAS113]